MFIQQVRFLRKHFHQAPYKTIAAEEQKKNTNSLVLCGIRVVLRTDATTTHSASTLNKLPPDRIKGFSCGVCCRRHAGPEILDTVWDKPLLVVKPLSVQVCEKLTPPATTRPSYLRG
jgi:hypothetical protein